MTRFRERFSAIALFASASFASAAAVDLSAFEADIDGPRTRILVLGSPHLSGMPDAFKPESLEPLLDRLARFEPAIITIEAVSGEGCDQLQRHIALYPDAAADYCWDTDAAQRATGLDVPAALAEVEKTLAEWPTDATPAQRRRLISLFAAANDRASTVVQWLQLPPAERRVGDGLDAAMVAQVEKTAASRNENILIGAVLAARLGLQRVHAVDDHSADGIQAKAGPALGETMPSIWAAAADSPMLAEAKRLQESGDMLATYRFYNAPETQREAIAVDFAAALRHASAEHYGRQYVAWWETRNLRMVANIRAAIGNRPGVRALTIVGSSHKPYFDAYLGLMHDIEVEDAETWLR
ncbi:MAG: DUF5694 domain-containing protein [Silanimonas sp.]